jgi:hypothetical protein
VRVGQDSKPSEREDAEKSPAADSTPYAARRCRFSLQEMRVNRGYGFVIGGYTRGTKTFDALIFRPTFLGGNGWGHLAVR